MLAKKNEAALSLNYGTNGLNIQGAYAFSDNIAAQLKKFAGHVSGTSLNNVFVVGDFNMILHYNGETWQVIEDDNNGWYQTVKVKENIVVMAGTKGGKGIIKIGRK